MLALLKKTATAVAAIAVGLGATVASAQIRLQGAGSTFVNPIMQRWVSEYQKLHPDVTIDYTSNGSGGGVKGFLDKTVDFACSDAPLTKEEIATAGGAANIVEFPIISGGVVPAYNLPTVKQELKFSGPVLADIYLGKITKWNDPKIVALNPGVTLPDTVITPAYRSDGSGTNFIFTSYLCTQNDDFLGTVGMGKQVKWPIGQGGQGNPGVAAVVQGTSGGLGYVEQAYADKNNISYGSVQNASGKFVKSSPATVSKAGEQAAAHLSGTMLATSLWNQKGDEAYPISGFTYVFVYKDLANVKDKGKAQALATFLAWASHQGQAMAIEIDYAPLSPAVQAKVEEAMKTLTFSGAPLAAK